VCAVAAALVCGCDAADALFVGSDSTPDGGAGLLDATSGAGSRLSVSIATDVADGCSGACVVLTASVTGGLPPYAYQWSPSVNADGGVAEVCPTVPTDYTVTVNAGSTRAGELPTPGSTASASVTITPGPGCAGSVDAGSLVYWATWQSVDAGAVYGTLSPPSGTIEVVYTGYLHGAQTTTGDDDFTPSATFTSATVANPPPGPGMIELSGESTQTDTLTFSRPVDHPVLAIYELGTGYAGNTASLLFGAPVAVLSSGLNAGGAQYFGNETLTLVDGGVSGTGGNGVVELGGTFSTLHWPNPSDTPYASFTGLTVGVRAQR
jgi:hypothetical protein